MSLIYLVQASDENERLIYIQMRIYLAWKLWDEYVLIKHKTAGSEAVSGQINRFLGDTIGRTILKLLVISFIVGVVMAAFNWSPFDVFYVVRDFIIRIWQQGFAALGRVGEYLALGAAIVVPVFLLLRILNYRRN